MAAARPAPDRRKASVLALVLITIVLTSFALIAFIDKDGNDLLIEARVAQSDRLRMEAYSALDATIAVLVDFTQADNGLRSPAEGWSDPLTWAGWTPSDSSRTVEVAFSDESGKIPLSRANSTELLNVFESWNMNPNDAQHLADALLAWMQQNYVPATPLETTYAQAALPYDPPYRSLRSFSELAAIDVVRDTFFDAAGRPNDLWWRFVNDFSLFNYRQVDVNGADPDVLAGLGQFSPDQLQSISDYQTGVGRYANQGPQWFQSAADLRGVVGTLSGTPGAFGTTISALRILITVHEGKALYRLSAVVAPPGGARTVLTTATDTKAGTSNTGTGETTDTSATSLQAKPTTAPTSAQTAAAATQNLQYPFTILELLENDGIPTPPPPPPPPQT